jgi:hypothetical protein
MSLLNLNAYKTIKGAYSKVGRNPVTTASVLRLMVPVTANKTSYTFPVLQGDATTTYTEAIYLNRADAFTATSVGIFLGGLTNAGTAAATASEYQLMGFQTETLTAAGVTNANSLFMHSYLNISVNNVQYLQNFDSFRTYSAPIIQTGNLLAAGGDTTAPNSVNGAFNGFAPLTPTLQFSGTAKIEISISLPTALAFTTAPVINLIFRGFLSLGASNLNK